MALTHKARMAAMIGLIAVLGAGCSLTKSSEKASIDAPPIGAEDMMAGGQTSSTVKGATIATTLYFKDDNGYVAPVSMPVPSADNAVAKHSLEYMVDGGPSKGMLPKSFTALLPKGTQVKGLDIKDKLATVNFSKEFNDYNAQDERKILEAITYTLTGFTTIDKVQIWVEGKPLKEMPVDATPLDEPLTRAMGMNLELGDGLKNVGESMPVTVFFHNETADHFSYYIPVTRMVEKSDNPAKSALAQLIKGPKTAKGLAPVLASTAQVLDVSQSSDKALVTVNFDDHILNTSKQVSDEVMQSVVLTLTENTGAKQVQMLVKGDSKVTSTDGKVNTKPVSKPTQVNPIKM